MVAIGQLHVSFQRTVREKAVGQPPSMGEFAPRPAADWIYLDSRRTGLDAVRRDLRPDALYFPMHDREALWVEFQAVGPTAVVVTAGGLNVVTGRPGSALEPGGYMVCPPQPWLDGGPDGYPFVSGSTLVFHTYTPKPGAVLPQRMGRPGFGMTDEDQRVYPDPYGIDIWGPEPAASLAVYLMPAGEYETIFGVPAPPLPPTYDQYKGEWGDRTHLW